MVVLVEACVRLSFSAAMPKKVLTRHCLLSDRQKLRCTDCVRVERTTGLPFKEQKWFAPLLLNREEAYYVIQYTYKVGRPLITRYVLFSFKSSCNSGNKDVKRKSPLSQRLRRYLHNRISSDKCMSLRATTQR